MTHRVTVRNVSANAFHNVERFISEQACNKLSNVVADYRRFEDVLYLTGTEEEIKEYLTNLFSANFTAIYAPLISIVDLRVTFTVRAFEDLCIPEMLEHTKDIQIFVQDNLLHLVGTVENVHNALEKSCPDDTILFEVGEDLERIVIADTREDLSEDLEYLEIVVTRK